MCIRDRFSNNGAVSVSSMPAGIVADFGGALAIEGSATITGSTLHSNQGTNGAALYVGSQGDVEIESTTFSGNNVTNMGGAIFSDTSVGLTVNHSTFFMNTAVVGGGAIHSTTVDGAVTNSLFSQNFGGDGAGGDGAMNVDLSQGYNAFSNNPSFDTHLTCLLYTSPSPRDATLSRMPSSA